MRTYCIFILTSLFFVFTCQQALAEALWDGSRTEPLVGDGSVEHPYEIGTPAELRWFAYLVNGLIRPEEDNSRACAVLTDDIVFNIDLCGENTCNFVPAARWESIGFNTSYKGHFNGNGHIVRGLYFYNNTAYTVGLFGKIGPEGKVENVGMEDIYILGKSDVGGIAGQNNGVVENCYVRGILKVHSSSASTNIGGIVGMNGGEMRHCYSTAKLMKGDAILGGGICAVNYVDGIIWNCYHEAGGSQTSVILENAEGNRYASVETSEFNSGKIAWLLQEEQIEETVWGQTCGEGYPELCDDKAVYKVYVQRDTNELVSYYGNVGDTIVLADRESWEMSEDEYCFIGTEQLLTDTIIVNGNVRVMVSEATHQLQLTCEEGRGEVRGGGTYAHGASVVVEAIAAEGYLFEAWSDGNSESRREVLVESDMTLGARFMADTTTWVRNYSMEPCYKIEGCEVEIIGPGDVKIYTTEGCEIEHTCSGRFQLKKQQVYIIVSECGKERIMIQ